MRVALIKTPATYADWYKRPVLGLGYLCSSLQVQGIRCRIFDAYFHSWSESELFRAIQEDSPDVIGFTAMTHEVKAAARVAGLIKANRDVPIVVGGCHVTALPERTLNEFPVFDYGIRGEGERSFAHLINWLGNGGASGREPMEGLVYRDGGSVRVNNDPQPLSSQDLDRLPAPCFQDYYGDDPRALAPKHCVYPIMTGRGCPYNCAFCMRVLGNRVRRRSPDAICEEIESAIRRWGAHAFDFYDDIMLHDDSSTRALLTLMIERDLPARMKWQGVTRADLISRELVLLARQAGCTRLGIGVESGDDDTLKAIGKAITIERVREAVRLIKEAGIEVDAYFILGHPNETGETIRKTINLAVELNPHMIAVGVMVPYPGTRICEMAIQGQGGYRLLTEDWAEYDKYGGSTLEVGGMSRADLVRWQRRAYLSFYLKNLRLFDLLKYLWKRRHALRLLIRGKGRTHERSEVDAEGST